MNGISRHHVIFERPDYQTEAELQFRNHRSLVVPMYDEWHLPTYPGSLHAEIEPPVKPDVNNIYGALIMLDSLRPRVRRDSLIVIDALSRYLRHHGEPMGENLERQLHYIRLGKVT